MNTTTRNQDYDLDLYELNLFYLLKARELALRGRTEAASLILGIPKETVVLLSQLPLVKIRAVARTGALCFGMRLTPAFWERVEADEDGETELFVAQWLLMVAGEGNGRADANGAS